jgi:hypothetical protein
MGVVLDKLHIIHVKLHQPFKPSALETVRDLDRRRFKWFSALENLLAAAGFGEVQARTLGGGPWMAAFAQLQGTVPKALLVLAFPFFALLDKVVLWRRPAWRGTWPLCVIADAKKL